MTKSGKINRPGRTAPLRTARLPDRDDKVEMAGEKVLGRDGASVSGTGGTRPLSAAIAEARDRNPLAVFGNSVVEGSRDLIRSGYRYPPNLTSQYYHAPGSVGCCADFVADAYAAAGFALGQEALSKGFNPHYCPSLIGYFRQEQQLISKDSPAHVGDVIFFDWEHDGKTDHVAIVTRVDANGRPTEIMESNRFNQPAHTSAVDPKKLGAITAFGRRNGAGADDGAAAQLAPVSNPQAVWGPSYGGSDADRGKRARVPQGRGYDRQDASGRVPSTPGPSSTPAILAAMAMVYEMIAAAYGLDDGQIQGLVDLHRAGGDVPAAAQRLGIPTDRIVGLAAAIDKAAAKSRDLMGDNNLPLPKSPDAWGMDADLGLAAFTEHRAAIEKAANAAGIEPTALAAYLWTTTDFDLGLDPSTTIRQGALELREAWQDGDLSGSAAGALDPEGVLSVDDKKETLQLFANRYAALRTFEPPLQRKTQ